MENNAKTIEEINEVIANVEKALTPNCEIGAHDNLVILKSQIKDPAKKIKMFPCKKEHSVKILTHFLKKEIPKNKYSLTSQKNIYLVFAEGTKKESSPAKKETTPPKKESAAAKKESTPAKKQAKSKK